MYGIGAEGGLRYRALSREQNGHPLEYAAPQLKADREFMHAAMKQNEYALAYTALEQKVDRDVVLEAVEQSEHPLEHAAPSSRRTV